MGMTDDWRGQGGMMKRHGGGHTSIVKMFRRPLAPFFAATSVRYGGQQLCDEVASLSNECARTCNRSRSRLEPAQQAQLDGLMAQLGALFVADLGAAADPGVDPAAGSAEAGGSPDDAAVGQCWEQLQVRGTGATAEGAKLHWCHKLSVQLH
jgi:hypothetical protein